MTIKGMILAATVALMAGGAAQAAPLSPAPLSGGEASVVLVRGGCGFGAHRGAYGGCRLNRGPRGAVRRAMTGAPRGCPPGLYRGRRGFCHR